MKISIYALSGIRLGKTEIKDSRLDQLDKLSRAPKKTYITIELVSEEAAADADAILASKDSRPDLILKDLEFVEMRLARATQEQEKILLNKLKCFLEKEEFVFNVALSEEEKKTISGYGLLTNRPVVLAEEKELDDLNGLLVKVIKEAGYISFFTTGEKETRAWLIKKGSTAWEAAGAVHSDIQRGFIRAEVISYDDFIQAGTEIIAKQTGKLRLEQKDYIVQDADIIHFRFNR